MTEAQFLTILSFGPLVILLLIKKAFGTPPAPIKPPEPTGMAICRRCGFSYDLKDECCLACAYAWYPDGITRNQIESHVNAAHVRKNNA